MKLKDWGAFILLSVVWGSSFLWIKISLEEVGPFLLVTMRLLFGALGLLAVLLIVRPPLPKEPRTLLFLAILGVTNTAVPFLLITLGEQVIDSGVASVLNGSVPLITLVIAHFLLPDEKITPNKALGLLAGFAGLVMIIGGDAAAVGLGSNIWGQLAVLLAAAFYAGSSVFIRSSLKGVHPIVQSSATVMVAGVLVGAITPLVESPLALPSLPITWIGLLWLGLMGSCLAYLLYFYLIGSIGATQATTVTYVFPVVGLLLGVIFLQERLDAWRIVGTVLVLGGVYMVNARKSIFKSRQAAPATQ